MTARQQQRLVLFRAGGASLTMPIHSSAHAYAQMYTKSLAYTHLYCQSLLNSVPSVAKKGFNKSHRPSIYLQCNAHSSASASSSSSASSSTKCFSQSSSAAAAAAAIVDHPPSDELTPIAMDTEPATIASKNDIMMNLPTSDESDELLRIRHSSAHVMAMAVQRLYPDVKVTIGPWIERGFYYDFDTSQATKLTGGNSSTTSKKKKPSDSTQDVGEESDTVGGDEVKSFSPKDLKKIMKEMRRIIKMDLGIEREEVTREEARRRIEEINEPYKLEILDSIPSDENTPITIYHMMQHQQQQLESTSETQASNDDDDDSISNNTSTASTVPPHPVKKSLWWDLCAGPHVDSTGDLDPDAILLEEVSGAYWRGDSSRAMLQRIYGTAWTSSSLQAKCAI